MWSPRLDPLLCDIPAAGADHAAPSVYNLQARPCPPLDSTGLRLPPGQGLPLFSRDHALGIIGYLKKLRDDGFRRRQEELRGYLEVATPVALEADRLYQEWREAVAEPVQDCQKAANRSAVYWWTITEKLRSFEPLAHPKSADRYHRLFTDALRNASQGSEVAKNGFRFNKFSEVSRGIGYLDEYVKLMAEAEEEMGRLVRKYRLLEDRS